ncbi:MAG: hypothetical protein IPK61_04210 [Saprospiraceae bacterium]|nr:hypothetical protein [Saprospiraceae bacterium]
MDFRWRNTCKQHCFKCYSKLANFNDRHYKKCSADCYLFKWLQRCLQSCHQYYTKSNCKCRSGQEVCEGGSTAIGGSPSGPSGSSFLWTPNLYLNSNTVANPISTPPVSITYTLTTTINGCTKTDQVTVTVNTLLNPLVSATANPDPICAGKTSTLTAQGSANGGRGGPFQYIWNNGLGAGAIKTTPALNQNTTYVVTVVDAAQCTATNSVTVDVTPCGSIGDYVWIDTDGDGIQDANESGLNGVTVLLKDQNGNVLSTKITTTGPSGLQVIIFSRPHGK